MIHTIRLSDHWTTSEVAPGVFCHARRFGSPRVTTETVWLAGTVSIPGTFTLNGEVLATIAEAFRVEITKHLQPRNAATIETAGAISDVRIEIV